MSEWQYEDCGLVWVQETSIKIGYGIWKREDLDVRLDWFFSSIYSVIFLVLMEFMASYEARALLSYMFDTTLWIDGYILSKCLQFCLHLKVHLLE